MHLPRIAPLALSLLLLASCGSPPAQSGGEDCQEQEAWSAGYAAGYEDGCHEGMSARPGPGEAGQPEDPEPAPSEPDPSGFVMLSDAVPDAVLEIRYHSAYNFVGERIDGYEAPVALLTREAAEALSAVSDDLAEQGYCLKIYDAYRPQRAVDHFRRWAADPEDISMKDYFYPELDKSVLFSQGYISARSGHSRGSTVDLTLFDMASGKEADMGGSFDWFGPRSRPGYTGLTEEQAANRKLLRDTMLAHGFRGIDTEWWHFTLKNEPYPDTYFDFPVEVLS